MGAVALFRHRRCKVISRFIRISRRLKQAAANFVSIPSRLRAIDEHVQQSTRMAANAEWDRLTADIARASPNRLEPFGTKRFSQNDEDGIIAEIFRRIGVTNRRFVEFGTGDGKENNTLSLLLQGWSGLWLEGDADKHMAQKRSFGHYVNQGSLVSKQAFLTRDNINAVISAAGLSGDIDLLSIDVDGNDLHLWKAISVIRPRVVVIEYNAYVAPPHRWVMPYSPAYVWNGKSTYFGASLSSLVALGESKGYRLVCCNLIGLNAFFVKHDCLASNFPYAGDIDQLYHPRRWWLDRVFCNARVDLALPYEDGAVAQGGTMSSD